MFIFGLVISSNSLNAGEPDYDAAFPNEHLKNEFQTEMARLSQMLGNKEKNEDLPDKISFIVGFIMLFALKDDIIPSDENSYNTTAKFLLTKLKGTSQSRNEGIFAHGFKPVTEKNYNGLSQVAEYWLKRFCEIEGFPYDQWLQDHCFITMYA